MCSGFLLVVYPNDDVEAHTSSPQGSTAHDTLGLFLCLFPWRFPIGWISDVDKSCIFACDEVLCDSLFFIVPTWIL
jgi:hypothetical protein